MRLGIALALASLSAPALAASTTVKITDQAMFAPKTVTIHAGDTVEWVNSSGAIHTVTDDPALAAAAKDSSLPAGAVAFNSGFLKSGQTYRHQFTVPGQYHYFCILHESSGMVGTVVVQ